MWRMENPATYSCNAAVQLGHTHWASLVPVPFVRGLLPDAKSLHSGFAHSILIRPVPGAGHADMAVVEEHAVLSLWEQLPLDVFLVLLGNLPLKDILSLQQVGSPIQCGSALGG